MSPFPSLNDITTRRYYKRVFEIPLGALPGDSWLSLRDKFKGEARVHLQRKLEEELLKILRTTIQATSQVRDSLRTDKVLETFETIAAAKHCFLIDLPLRGWMAGGDAPPFVSDYKRRHFSAPSTDARDPQLGKLWLDDMGKIMRGVVFLRLFCEPTIHTILTRVVKMDELHQTIRELIPELKGVRTQS